MDFEEYRALKLIQLTAVTSMLDEGAVGSDEELFEIGRLGQDLQANDAAFATWLLAYRERVERRRRVLRKLFNYLGVVAMGLFAVGLVAWVWLHPGR